MRFFFCKATTTLCVNSRKNRRGAIKQNRLNKQNGAGRLFTAPEPSVPSGRCSEAEAGPETERCAAGRWPVVHRDNFRARNGRWFEPGRGSRVGQGCALFKTSGSGRNVSHTAPPALLFPTKSCGAGFRGGPSSAHRAAGALFLFIGHKQSCASALAKAAQAANIVTLQQVCDKVKRRRFAKRRRPPWNPRSKPNTSWPMP